MKIIVFPSRDQYFVLAVTLFSTSFLKFFFFFSAIIYSFLGVTLTNLCAVTGFICIPFKNSKYFNLVLSFMMALAVSALFTTAILVLIPEVNGLLTLSHMSHFGSKFQIKKLLVQRKKRYRRFMMLHYICDTFPNCRP